MKILLFIRLHIFPLNFIKQNLFPKIIIFIEQNLLFLLNYCFIKKYFSLTKYFSSLKVEMVFFFSTKYWDKSLMAPLAVFTASSEEIPRWSTRPSTWRARTWTWRGRWTRCVCWRGLLSFFSLFPITEIPQVHRWDKSIHLDLSSVKKKLKKTSKYIQQLFNTWMNTEKQSYEMQSILNLVIVLLLLNLTVIIKLSQITQFSLAIAFGQNTILNLVIQYIVLARHNRKTKLSNSTKFNSNR